METVAANSPAKRGSAAAVADRVYRGRITHIGYDLREARMRVDVASDEPEESGRSQLYFESAAAQSLAALVHEAFVRALAVEVWVVVTDPAGRSNVIYTINFARSHRA